eukprot:3573205-Rhodomonas_salina.1
MRAGEDGMRRPLVVRPLPAAPEAVAMEKGARRASTSGTLKPTQSFTMHTRTCALREKKKKESVFQGEKEKRKKKRKKDSQKKLERRKTCRATGGQRVETPGSKPCVLFQGVSAHTGLRQLQQLPHMSGGNAHKHGDNGSVNGGHCDNNGGRQKKWRAPVRRPRGATAAARPLLLLAPATPRQLPDTAHHTCRLS